MYDTGGGSDEDTEDSSSDDSDASGERGGVLILNIDFEVLSAVQAHVLYKY